jgi:hypothetical protein
VCKKKNEKNETTGENQKSYYCLCNSLYSGDDCSIRWYNDRTWRGVFTVYAVLVIISNAGICGWAIYELYITFRYSGVKGWKKWTVNTLTMFLIAGGSLSKS